MTPQGKTVGWLGLEVTACPRRLQEHGAAAPLPGPSAFGWPSSAILAPQQGRGAASLLLPEHEPLNFEDPSAGLPDCGKVGGLKKQRPWVTSTDSKAKARAEAWLGLSENP